MGKRMIDADELIEVVQFICEEDGSEEAQRWCGWVKRVIDATYNQQLLKEQIMKVK